MNPHKAKIIDRSRKIKTKNTFEYTIPVIIIIIHFNDKIQSDMIVYAQRRFISIVFIIRKTKMRNNLHVQT